MTIHRLIPEIEVHTPLGHGRGIAWIDYGEMINTVWKVRLDDGRCRNFYDTDVLIYPNPMNKEYEIAIPSNWEQIKKK